ncbi:hypothetical protein [Streptomyces cavernicola]|uniref:Uncharacterized protein n=1 Tax=Streptomyces cavernicola TaxID=3043613 RepID=A0ABT6S8S8_9ACTN|nr:hypothetical protein [Streptomyces sp. B-S-A6]MDI3404437.1 hypothetical protein [Streptomyces sp. B-S-A6]
MTGGEIKGAGDGRAPVDQERSARGVVGADSDASDVMVTTAARAVIPDGVINSPEAESGFDTGEFGGAAGLLVGGDVPLQLGLPAVPQLRQRAAGGLLPLGPESVETGVEAVDELLFTLQLAPQFVLQFNGIPG